MGLCRARILGCGSTNYSLFENLYELIYNMKGKIKILPAASFLLLLFFLLNTDNTAIHYIPFQTAAILYVLTFLVLPVVEKFVVPKLIIAIFSVLILVCFCLWLIYGWDIFASAAISLVAMLIIFFLRMYNQSGIGYHFKKLFKLLGR